MTADEGDDRNPLDRLLDLGVYAPLGFALEFRRLVPELAEAGRRQIDFSRSLGRAALRTIARSGSAGGTASRPTAPSSPRASTAVEAEPPSPPTEPAAGAEEPVAEVPVAGYGEMSAKQAIAVARDASPAQLAWMRRREQAAKNRKTVLAAIDRAGGA